MQEIIKDKNILFIDDNPSNISYITAILANNNYGVFSNNSIKESLQLLSGGSIDLVLLDISSSDIEGFKLCNKIKSYYPDIPLIIITSLKDEDTLKKSFDFGADDFLTKPINEIELISRINNSIRIKEYEKKINNLYQDVVRDLEVASRIQSYLLPKWLINDEAIIFSSTYSSSRFIGGDIFNIVKISEKKYIVYIGDISGHGIQAALLMTAIKSIIELIIDSNKKNFNLADFLTELNKTLSKELFRENYMTLLVGIVDLKKNIFKYQTAGHPSLICIDKTSQKIDVIDGYKSIPLGWKSDYDYGFDRYNKINLEDNKIYLLYTDGIFECADSGMNQLGMDGLSRLLENMDEKNPLIFPNIVKQKLIENKMDLSSDDFTILSFSKNILLKNNKYKLVSVKSDLKNVSDIGNLCESIVIDWTGDIEFSNKVEIVVVELLNNLIIHSLELKNDTYVILEFSFYDKLIIRAYEEGNKWEMENIDLLNINVINNKFDLSGRGLKIIDSFTESFRRERYGSINMTEIVFN